MKLQTTSTETRIPSHVAIIMDGNGRWAKSRGLPRSVGHKKGAEVVKTIVESALSLNVKYLTLFGFSSENIRHLGGPAQLRISHCVHIPTLRLF